MAKFEYLNYKDVNERLANLVNNTNSKIKVVKKEPLGYTDFKLPIEHYRMGQGLKHIVVTGSYHSAEIITTIFIVHLMEELALNGGFNPKEYTIDFIPIVNPEGYLITTQMQDLYLAKANTEDEKIKLAKDYWAAYKQDAVNTLNANKMLKKEDLTVINILRGKKEYEALFDDVNLDDYLKDYPELKESVVEIIKKNGYSAGVLAAWTANGHGIDLSQNAPFNSLIEKYKKNGPCYSGTVYSNIRKDVPGPINTPCRDLNNFTFEVENKHMLNFLWNLEHTKDVSIEAFLNYHSVMGKIYQKPIEEDCVVNLYDIDYSKKLIENYNGARVIRSENAYDIIEDVDPFNYINEYFRLRYGINIQVELSRMGSNPIGPLADPDTFMNITVKPNIEAFKKFVNDLEFIKEYSKFINNLVFLFNNKRKNNNESILDSKEVYRLIDNICCKTPTLYTKLKEELKNKNYNAHVITYLFHLIETSLENKEIKEESESIKKRVIYASNSVDKFTERYTAFINDIVDRLNKDRVAKKQDLLNSDEIELLIDNICKDYPEIYTKLKFELNKEEPNEEIINELEIHLSRLINNQIKMLNLLPNKIRN